MNKNESFVFYLGVVLWYFGDLITTFIGFQFGHSEKNPFLVDKSFFQIFLLKTAVLGIFFIVVGYLDNHNKKAFKAVCYSALIVVGSIVTFGNSLTLLGVVE